MKILAVDLSGAEGSIALIDGAEERFCREFPNDRKHSGAFFENVQACLEQFGNPERIVVGLGPGSYAGTRIAIAAAIGLHAGTGAELVGTPSFLALPTDAPEYAVIGDARRQLFSFAHVLDRRSLAAPVLYLQSELEERLERFPHPFYSAELLPSFPRAIRMHPSARILAELGPTQTPAALPLEPIYLREPHITQPRAVAL